jgi:hypothetical protein
MRGFLAKDSLFPKISLISGFSSKTKTFLISANKLHNVFCLVNILLLIITLSDNFHEQCKVSVGSIRILQQNTVFDKVLELDHNSK